MIKDQNFLNLHRCSTPEGILPESIKEGRKPFYKTIVSKERKLLMNIYLM